jgi:4-oxalocrotonate tautomerase
MRETVHQLYDGLSPPQRKGTMKLSFTTRERVMPFLHLTISSTSLSATQRHQLQTGLTTLMAEILRKQADLTVVAIDRVAPEQWSAGGQALATDAWAAELEVAITAGTNTADECARFIEAAHALLRSAWPTAPSAPLYIVVRELPATHWGYDGQTQAARHAPT